MQCALTNHVKYIKGGIEEVSKTIEDKVKLEEKP